MYDAGNKKSFDNLTKWLEEMKNELGNSKEMDNVVFCVCANKVRSASLATFITRQMLSVKIGRLQLFSYFNV